MQNHRAVLYISEYDVWGGVIRIEVLGGGVVREEAQESVVTKLSRALCMQLKSGLWRTTRVLGSGEP